MVHPVPENQLQTKEEFLAEQLALLLDITPRDMPIAERNARLEAYSTEVKKFMAIADAKGVGLVSRAQYNEVRHAVYREADQVEREVSMRGDQVMAFRENGTPYMYDNERGEITRVPESQIEALAAKVGAGFLRKGATSISGGEHVDHGHYGTLSSPPPSTATIQPIAIDPTQKPSR